MCSGPVEEIVKFPAKAISNVVKDVTGVTEKRKIQKYMEKQAEANALAAENQAIINKNKQSTLTIGAEADAANQAAAAAAARRIAGIRQQQIQAQIAARNAAARASNAAMKAANTARGAAQTSQGIIDKQGKKKKKGLKISPKDAYAKGTGSPGSTSASLKIGSQGTSPGTGTNLPV